MSSDAHTVEHRLSDNDENIHYRWCKDYDPVLTIEPGDTVRFECRPGHDGQLGVESTPEDFAKQDIDRIHPLTGPVAVEGAVPGDVLQVELLDLQHKGWGVTGFPPGKVGKGLLPEEFPDPGLFVWHLDDSYGYFVDGIRVPLAPFPGTIGVAPEAEGEHRTIPPRDVGGNIDNKQLTEGSTLYLPIEVPEALFSVGDCHAAQGDGEVCLTAIETPMFVTAKFGLKKAMSIEQPQFETAVDPAQSEPCRGVYGTIGISDDLRDASKRAIRQMIDYLYREYGLSKSEAYILCSVAVDLRINQVVNSPNWTVSAHLPNDLFP